MSKKTIEIKERNLALEAVRVTEAAALSASSWIGLGDEKKADEAAVKAMRESLNTLDIDGEVVIGEGERDKAPMLYIGEKVGTRKGPQVDIALDPLEGTTICATGGNNALTVIAFSEKGGFLNAPDVYMDKIAVGGSLPKDIIDIDEEPEINIKNLAKVLKKEVNDLVVCILDRPRHKNIIRKCREIGARIMLIPDGDVSGIIATGNPEAGVDMYLGIGGAPEGVLAAAALRCIGGQMQARLKFYDEAEKLRAKKLGISDFSKKYLLSDLASEKSMFAATGVTDGSMLKGVKIVGNKAITESIIMRSTTGTVRTIKAIHKLNSKN